MRVRPSGIGCDASAELPKRLLLCPRTRNDTGKVSNTPADQLRALLAESGLTLVPVRPAHVTADAISAPGDPSGQVQPVTPSSLPLAQWRRQLTKFCRIGVANSAKYA